MTPNGTKHLVRPLVFQAWRLEGFEFLPCFELPFFSHQLQPAWFPWGERRPFFSKGFLECFSEHGVMSFPMYSWGRLTPIFSSSFYQCFCQYGLSSSSWGRLTSIFCSELHQYFCQYVVASPPAATSVWYQRGRCPPFFSPSFSGENGVVSCASSVYIWGGSLVGNISTFRWQIRTLNTFDGESEPFELSMSNRNIYDLDASGCLSKTGAPMNYDPMMDIV